MYKTSVYTLVKGDIVLTMTYTAYT